MGPLLFLAGEGSDIHRFTVSSTVPELTKISLKEKADT